jgi:glycosyltransferase involved in cell wall biosynthesis
MVSVDIVLQATGEHAWGVNGGWVNAAKALGVLNKCFRPRCGWGEIVDDTNDDGLFRYLTDGFFADIILLLGFDWHSQGLHTTSRWQGAWDNCDAIKILYVQESLANHAEQTLSEDMLLAFQSAAKLADLVVYTDLADKEIIEKHFENSFWMPFGVDTTVYKPQTKLSDRINKSFFRGKVQPLSNPNEYSERREILEALVSRGLIDVIPYAAGKIEPEDLASEFNKYQIAVNLPSVFTGHTTRVTEGLACGCVVVTPRVNSSGDDIFSDKELIYYDSAEHLISILESLDDNEELKNTLSEQGLKAARERFSLSVLLEELLSHCEAVRRKKRKKALFVDHVYHKKTKSSRFFTDILSKSFDIDILYDESYFGKETVTVDAIEKDKYDAVFIWQCIQHIDFIASFTDIPVYCIPMFDQSGYASRESLSDQCTYISFSKTLHDRFVSFGLTSLHVQYFPNVHSEKRAAECGLRGFLWQRTEDVTWETISLLTQNAPFDQFHIHLAPDTPSLQYPEVPSKHSSAEIRTSLWFEDKNGYEEVLMEANVFFVPRRYEGIGMTFLEAMALGMCVVAPNEPTMNEYIQHGYNGLLYDYDNPQPLDFTNAKEIGKNARNSIAEGRMRWVADRKMLAKRPWSIVSKRGSTAGHQNCSAYQNDGCTVNVGKRSRASVMHSFLDMNFLHKLYNMLPKKLQQLATDAKYKLLVPISSRLYLERTVRIINKSGLFFEKYYIDQNPDIQGSGLSPLKHYILHGGFEGRKPNPLFDSAYYLSANADVVNSGMSPLIHYYLFGWKELRDPSEEFSSRGYLSQNIDIAIANECPLAHYLFYGIFENRRLR